MRRLVTVALRQSAAASALHSEGLLQWTGSCSALVLRGTSAGRTYEFTALAGFARNARAASADEHFAADVDTYHEHCWLSCSDVLYASRVRPSADAVRWLTDVAAAYPGCRLAAAPLTEGGWAIFDGTNRTAVFLAPWVPADQPLLASCLHTWLVARHQVRTLHDIHVLRRE